MFWLSVALAILIGLVSIFHGSVGVGLPTIGLALAGNAYVRLQRGQPMGTPTKKNVVWVALAVAGLALAIGLLRALR
jgi:hypothetical protein